MVFRHQHDSHRIAEEGQREPSKNAAKTAARATWEITKKYKNKSVANLLTMWLF